MPPTQDKVSQLKSIIELLQSSVTKAEFVDAFQQVLEVVKDLKQSNSQEWSLIKSAFDMLKQKVESTMEEKMSTAEEKMMKACMKEMESMKKGMDKMTKEQMDAMKFIYDKVRGLKNGKDGKDGDPGPAGKDAVEETPEETRNKLESLTDNDRLDKSAIKGIEEIEKDIKEIQIRPAGRVGGAKGIALYIGGAKKLLSAQTINLVAGANITLSYAYANGRNDITITGGAGASLSPIAMTGTVDDSNTSFTAASEPTLVIINGASYRHGKGVTISGTSVTTDSPVGTGGDIYGL